MLTYNIKDTVIAEIKSTVAVFLIWNRLKFKFIKNSNTNNN